MVSGMETFVTVHIINISKNQVIVSGSANQATIDMVNGSGNQEAILMVTGSEH